MIGNLEDASDYNAISLVYKMWYRVDALTHKHVTIAFYYTITSFYLSAQFPGLESLKLKGKPRAAMFNLIPLDWSEYVESWINYISKTFLCLKSLHLRRMIVTNEYLSLLARDRENILQVLKLENCLGFRAPHNCTILQVIFVISFQSLANQKEIVFFN